jgi:hypothetical protein
MPDTDHTLDQLTIAEDNNMYKGKGGPYSEEGRPKTEVTNQTEVPTSYQSQLFINTSSLGRETLFALCNKYSAKFRKAYRGRDPLAIELKEFWFHLRGLSVPDDAVDRSALDDRDGTWSKAEGFARGLVHARNIAFHHWDGFKLEMTLRLKMVKS